MYRCNHQVTGLTSNVHDHTEAAAVHFHWIKIMCSHFPTASHLYLFSLWNYVVVIHHWLYTIHRKALANMQGFIVLWLCICAALHCDRTALLFLSIKRTAKLAMHRPLQNNCEELCKRSLVTQYYNTRLRIIMCRWWKRKKGIEIEGQRLRVAFKRRKQKRQRKSLWN